MKGMFSGYKDPLSFYLTGPLCQKSGAELDENVIWQIDHEV